MAPLTTCLNRGCCPPLGERLSSFRAQYIVSLLCKARRVCCKVFWCCYCGSRHSLSYFGFLFLMKADCNFQRKVLKTLYNILFTVAEVVSRIILYHFKAINWIGSHWRGTQRRIPVEGVNSVINFCLWRSDSMLIYICLSVCFPSIFSI